jgi:hypothetical protein
MILGGEGEAPCIHNPPLNSEEDEIKGWYKKNGFSARWRRK